MYSYCYKYITHQHIDAATGVSVSNPQTDSITVSWTTVADVYYMVQYSNGTSAMYKDSLNTRTQTSPQTISLPIPGAEYTVRVLAFNYMDSTLGGDGVESNNVTFTAVPSDVVPTSANPSGTNITLDWTYNDTHVVSGFRLKLYPSCRVVW
ncbi:hypothetical protein EB796_011143 [Bugula neritina]|uniref:Fibronectin type-III domain-containing protein n=1 Tax=Bugula neritina TaxID=10212 RepID=A0A7J7JW01_BUGNE|nr:hypothetical protein EB796_011143 [Bugula neritina]